MTDKKKEYGRGLKNMYTFQFSIISTLLFSLEFPLTRRNEVSFHSPYLNVLFFVWPSGKIAN